MEKDSTLIMVLSACVIVGFIIGIAVGYNCSRPCEYQIFKAEITAAEMEQITTEGWEFQQRATLGDQDYLIFRKWK